MPDSSPLTCDTIIDRHPFSGRQNMALDAALLNTGLHSQRCTVRIYRWSEPTVSVGYFQTHDAIGAGPLRELPCVRRLTGGGAILHHQELTYSCVVPETHPVRSDPSRLYLWMHTAIVQLLSELGVSSRLRAAGPGGLRQPMITPGGKHPPAGTAEPFLCFLRTDPNDIVSDIRERDSVHYGTHKIVGSAQRRRRGTILQHGTILLRASAYAPDVPGIEDLFPQFDVHPFETELPNRLAAMIAGHVNPREYTNDELHFAEQWVEELAEGSRGK